MPGPLTHAPSPSKGKKLKQKQYTAVKRSPTRTTAPGGGPSYAVKTGTYTGSNRKAKRTERQIQRAIGTVRRSYATRGGSPNSPGGTTWTPSEVATLAHRKGATKAEARQLSTKVVGESSGNAKAVGKDPGGTLGLGLLQVTTGYNDDVIRKYGGRKAMLKPGPNVKAATEILRRQGIGAWYAPSNPAGKIKPRVPTRRVRKAKKTLHKAGVPVPRPTKGPVAPNKRPFKGTATPRPNKIVNPKWDPDDDGHTLTKIKAAISPAMKRWSRRYGVTIGAALDPGGGHVSEGHNVTGTSTDVYPEQDTEAGWDRLERGLAVLTRAGFEVFYDGTAGTDPEPNHGRGNHAHIEWVPNSENATSRDALKKFAGFTNAQLAAITSGVTTGGGAVSTGGAPAGVSGPTTTRATAAKKRQRGVAGKKAKLRKVQATFSGSGGSSITGELDDLLEKYGRPAV